MASTAATDGVEPSCSYKWKWQVKNDGTYLLSLNLPDLKMGDFLVRVDGKRRLTITDRREPTAPGGKAPRLNKTFQLPKTANTDAITGCFHGDVLTLTVPIKGKQQPALTVAAKKEEAEPKAKAEREKELIDTAVAAFHSRKGSSPAGIHKS